MKSVRGRFSIGKYGNLVYACGGSDGNSDVKTIECYFSEEDKWEVIAEVPQPKASPGKIVCLNCVELCYQQYCTLL